MMKTKKFILSMMNFKKHLAIAAALLLSLTMTTQAKIYTWDKYNIAFEAPEGGQVPFSFFQDPNSAQVEWDEMVMTLQRYIKNENTNVGGILGSRFSTKRKIYELLNHYYEQPLSIFNTQDKKDILKFAIDQIYNYPLMEGSKFILGRMMRTATSHDDIVDTVNEMYEKGNLCRVDEDSTKHKDPTIICSMGLKA